MMHDNRHPESDMRVRRDEYDHRLDHPNKKTSWTSVIALAVFIIGLIVLIILL